MFVSQVLSCVVYWIDEQQLLQYSHPPPPKWQYWQSTKQILVNLLPFKQIFSDPAPNCSQDKTCSREISRECCWTCGTLIPSSVFCSFYHGPVKQNIQLPSHDTTLSSTFKPVRDICFSLLFVRTLKNVCFKVTWHGMRMQPLPSILYTLHCVRCLPFNQHLRRSWKWSLAWIFKR